MEKRQYTAFLLLTCILLGVFSSTNALGTTEPQRVNVIVGFNNTPDLELLTNNGGIIHEVYSIIPAVFVSLPQDCLEQLKENPNVKYIQENSMLKTAGEVRWGINHVNATQAWSKSTGEGVKVAVLDTGVGPVDAVPVYGGYNFVGDNTNYSDDSAHSHGTMVAGIIAASSSSPLGVAGVAPNAHIYSVKIIDSNGVGTLSNAISGIQWAVNNGMQIISMSWTIYDENNALQNALQAAYDNGILLVAAVGNIGDVQSGIGCPAIYDSVIAVSAVKEDNTRLLESSFGEKVELTAPGENVYSTLLNNVLGWATGTSFATGFVSGTAALIWAKNPSLTNIQIRDILDKTSTDLDTAGRDIYYGYGLVNASAAVFATPSNSAASFTWLPTPAYANEQVKFDASSSFGGVSGYTVYKWNFGDGNTTTVNSSVVEHSFATEGTYSVSLEVSDSFGFQDSIIQSVSVTKPTPSPTPTQSSQPTPTPTISANTTSTPSPTLTPEEDQTLLWSLLGIVLAAVVVTAFVLFWHRKK